MVHPIGHFPKRFFFVMLVLIAASTLALFVGCSGGSGSGVSQGGESVPASSTKPPRPGTTVVQLEFLLSYENERNAFYFPIEGLAGCAFGPEGTLIFCDEKRGKVYGLDPGTLTWYEFDSPNSRPYRPLDVVVDGFKILVLDSGGNSVFRYDLSGAYLDRLLDIRQVDPSNIPQVTAFSLDRDGRMLIADVSQQQVLLLDAFLQLQMRVGMPGTLDDQFTDPSGITFLPDGGFVVTDRGNRRLCRYGRLGFFEGTIGGDFDVDNPFILPQGVDSDEYGNLFVADQGNGRIHVLDRRFRPLTSIGDDFGLRGTPTAPVDVAVGPGDVLAVTDRARSAILVYRIIYE
ncbi:MAG: NHL repeat-containing protein [Candidatus Krumholzibacteria bacterium]|nr:NHL repeat-containing protein [Candidatus Krumholzibacteria bacterium]